MQFRDFATQIDQNVLRDLHAYAARADLSISRLVSDAIAEYQQRARVRPAFLSAMEDVLYEDAGLLRRLAK